MTGNMTTPGAETAEEWTYLGVEHRAHEARRVEEMTVQEQVDFGRRNAGSMYFHAVRGVLISHGLQDEVERVDAGARERAGAGAGTPGDMEMANRVESMDRKSQKQFGREHAGTPLLAGVLLVLAARGRDDVVGRIDAPAESSRPLHVTARTQAQDTVHRAGL
jgi:hypothetical protein